MDRTASRSWSQTKPGPRSRAALARRAADLHGILARREPEARRVLQALFNERLAFAPFNEGSTRGYQFLGTGSYGGLLVGDTCPTSHGGPNGIRSRVPTSPHAFASKSTTCGVLSQRLRRGDGNQPTIGCGGSNVPTATGSAPLEFSVRVLFLPRSRRT